MNWTQRFPEQDKLWHLVGRWLYEHLSEAEQASLPQPLKHRVQAHLCDLIKEAEEGIRAGRVTDGQQAMRRLWEELVP